MRWPLLHKYVGPILVILLSLAPAAVSTQNSSICIPLRGSKLCSNFTQASVSTSLIDHFPFLQFVSTLEEFDTQFRSFIHQDYAKRKYLETMQCQNINLANTSYLYARFTETVLCAQMVQESITPCGLNEAQAPPVCASTCADFATSEETIVMTPELCGGNTLNFINLRIPLVRADFTVCSLPANSLSSSCVDGLENEPQNCGFGSNLPQLCTYCGRTSPNATSFCCLSSNLTACASIHIPPTVTLPPLFMTTTLFTATATAPSNSTSGPRPGANNGLSTGAIVGIAIGGTIAALLLAAIIALFCIRARRRSTPPNGLRRTTSSVPMSCGPFPERNGYDPIKDESRVIRMPALHTGETSILDTSPEITPPRGPMRMDHSSSSEGNALSSPDNGSPLVTGAPPPPTRPYVSSITSSPTQPGLAEAAMFGAGAAVASTSRTGGNGKRVSRTSTTLSSTSPQSAEASEAASVSVVADHYSTNAILQHSEVVALWSYTPRLGDEMSLERGDVVCIENLYDDGWALGRKLRTKIWDMLSEESRSRSERDSGIGTLHRESTSSGRRGSLEHPSTAGTTSDKGKEKEIPETGSIKAFPMVCVCHRDAWSEVIAREEEESTTPTPELGSRRLSPTRLALDVPSDPTDSSALRKETRFESEEPLSSTDNSPTRIVSQGGITSRSSSQGSSTKLREQGT